MQDNASVQDNGFTSSVNKRCMKKFTTLLFKSNYKIAGISIQLNNLKKGQYKLSLFNTSDQKVIEKIVVHSGGSPVQATELPSTSSRGLSHLEVSGNEQVFHHRLIKN